MIRSDHVSIVGSFVGNSPKYFISSLHCYADSIVLMFTLRFIFEKGVLIHLGESKLLRWESHILRG